MAIIDVKHLSYQYEKQTTNVLDDINFQVNCGEWVAIVGHNGSGKSTLLRCLDGLLVPQSGQIKIDNLIMNDDNIWEIRQKIGMIFQNPDDQFVRATVADDVAFALENAAMDVQLMHQRVAEALQAVGMSAYAQKAPAQLSGGQKQRVALAGVIAQRPKIMLLDEATSMLDPHGRQTILQIIAQLHHDYQLTILSVTHDINEAALADRILVIDNGHLINEGTPAAIFADEQALVKMGLPLPYTEQLKKELHAYHLEMPTQYYNIREMADYLWTLYSKM